MLLLNSAVGVAGSDGNKVKLAKDLDQVAQEASDRKLPVLVFFAGVECGYCEALEEDHLGIMANSDNYRNKVIIRKVFIDDYEDMRDFQGKRTTSDDFSDRFSIRITPTLVLTDHNGQALTKKILGYNRSDFFGYYLDEAIAEAKNRIN